MSTENPQAARGVRVSQSGGKFQLIRNGQPFFIKGVGGDASKELLVQCGGNSFRTWGAEGIGEILDEAHRLNLAVTVGIWLKHPNDMDYGDPVAVKAQFEMAKQVVSQYKDHPALLIWAFGNEMEGDSRDIRIWKAVNDIAKMSKQIDPNHPTMTVIADIGDQRVPNLHQHCPDIDIVGINSYGGAFTLKDRYLKAGGKKPYILTEFGPLGQWEVGKTPWDAPIEMSSTEKAKLYGEAYQKAVLDADGLCLGSYAFLWGNKQEATSTWFGMLLPDGKRLAAIDVMTKLWSGKPQPNLSPNLLSLKVSQSTNLKPGDIITASVEYTDPESDPIKAEWRVMSEARIRYTAGRPEPVPESYPDAVIKVEGKVATIKIPDMSGGLRIFAYIYDSAGGAAVHNIPILVGSGS
ncbi:glycoside hydrolase family 2 TIM barrel-domain containing protein [Kamptonema cortianum]|nr:glycoside hydrolase family 2 TIM barrel-domain containing protein [Geitlerinema splendidum]MDK3158446.1 glycoside hydrolase family 2 TIM barrel-domain containing protein [Kamptonema cortianum]